MNKLGPDMLPPIFGQHGNTLEDGTGACFNPNTNTANQVLVFFDTKQVLVRIMSVPPAHRINFAGRGEPNAIRHECTDRSLVECGQEIDYVFTHTARIGAT